MSDSRPITILGSDRSVRYLSYAQQLQLENAKITDPPRCGLTIDLIEAFT